MRELGRKGQLARETASLSKQHGHQPPKLPINAAEFKRIINVNVNANPKLASVFEGHNECNFGRSICWKKRKSTWCTESIAILKKEIWESSSSSRSSLLIMQELQRKWSEMHQEEDFNSKKVHYFNDDERLAHNCAWDFSHTVGWWLQQSGMIRWLFSMWKLICYTALILEHVCPGRPQPKTRSLSLCGRQVGYPPWNETGLWKQPIEEVRQVSLLHNVHKLDFNAVMVMGHSISVY